MKTRSRPQVAASSRTCCFRLDPRDGAFAPLNASRRSWASPPSQNCIPSLPERRKGRPWSRGVLYPGEWIDPNDATSSVQDHEWTHGERGSALRGSLEAQREASGAYRRIFRGTCIAGQAALKLAAPAQVREGHCERYGRDGEEPGSVRDPSVTHAGLPPSCVTAHRPVDACIRVNHEMASSG